jgi:hypothetical protein
MSADIKIEYTNVPSGAMSGSTTTASNKASFVNMADFKTQRNVPKYATLEINRNLLYTSTSQMYQNSADTPTGYGYISTYTSSMTGTLTNITITRTYDQNYTSPRSYD